MSERPTHHVPVFGVGLVGGVMFTIFFIVGFNVIHVDPTETSMSMSYADMAAVMLGAVAVLVTILGVFIAILALWGYSQFKRSASDAAVEHVKAELVSGKLRDDLNNLLVSEVIKQMDDGKLRKIMEEYVDRIVISGPATRAREETENPMGDEEKEYGA